MNDKATEYRRRVEQAERKAEVATDLEAKRAYRRVADSYRELVALLEPKSNKSSD